MDESRFSRNPTLCVTVMYAPIKRQANVNTVLDLSLSSSGFLFSYNFRVRTSLHQIDSYHQKRLFYQYKFHMKIDTILPDWGSEKNMSTTRLRTRQTKPTTSCFPLLVYLNQYRHGLSMMLTTTDNK